MQDGFTLHKPSYVAPGVTPVLPNTWTEPPAGEFLVRGPKYLGQGDKNVLELKQPSKEAPYACLGINVFRSSTRLEHSADKVGDLRRFLEARCTSEDEADSAGGGMPKFLVICWMFGNVFGTEFTLVQHLFRRVGAASGEDRALDAAFSRFLRADDAGKNSQLKYLFKVVDGPGAMTTAVTALGGERPVLIGKKLTTTYFRGQNYLEIDMDVGSSVVASMLNSTLLKTSGAGIVDCAWTCEAQHEDELPERILAKCRWNYCDCTSIVMDLVDGERKAG